MTRAGVRLVALRSRAIFEAEFNDLCDGHGSKGAALSHETLALAARAIEALPREKGDRHHLPERPGGCCAQMVPVPFFPPCQMICDKHGGRNRYGALLQEHFPDDFIEVRGEGPRQSVYQFGSAGRRVEVLVSRGSRGRLPAALASMASKYLRELSMLAVNDFWRRRVPSCGPRPATRPTPNGFATRLPRRSGHWRFPSGCSGVGFR